MLLQILVLTLLSSSTADDGGGQWQLLQNDIGVLPMHMQLLHNDRVVIYDRTDFGTSNLSLPDGKCRMDPNDTALQVDCTAHSLEYDVASNSFRPLMVQTDVWCSAGAAMSDGTLVQTGGFNDGDRRVRIFKPYPDGSDWEEIPFALSVRRWYPTNHILPDGRQIVIGGRRQFNYEFFPKTGGASKAYSLPFLVETNDRLIENNLYPFVFLNIDGSLFIFANNRSILFDYARNKVLKTFPAIPGGDPRCYPSTGSAVLLPLRNLKAATIGAEVLVCGGAPKGSFNEAQNRTFVKALNTCARTTITDPKPEWVIETMPVGRVMGDMILLPNGDVLIINGAGLGTAGWDNARDPVLNPVVYRPSDPPGLRFRLLNPSTIPRLYHSTAVLLGDGRILVGGSNPNVYYNFTGVPFPTELRLEAFSPPYLDPKFENLRPIILSPSSQTKVRHAQQLVVRFKLTGGGVTSDTVDVTMVAPPFNTHSFSMSQRLLVIGGENVTKVGNTTWDIHVSIPGSGNIAPSGYYLLFVVHGKIPSKGIWIRIA
ncbi:aldehyde oxidase GLOX1-like [Cucurbita pepo subsp. pepo]|uniref:aldehyde oxidase GLOX1-like n=1 Tax=Cucurbita pepo subsp. pepo TaxID=3664 RepID=UPI000C9D4BDF|nr:aldehyde oxidase GLOX1-like [Cucurbita pepo subsp. pepo]